MASIRTSSIVAALALFAVAGCTPGDEASPSVEADVYSAYSTATPYFAEDMGRDELLVPQPDGNTYVFFIKDGYVVEIQWGQNLAGGSYGGDLCAL